MPIKAVGAHKVDGDVSCGAKAKSPRCKRKANVDASGGAKAKSPKHEKRPISSCEKATQDFNLFALTAGENLLADDATPPSSIDGASSGSGSSWTGSDVLGLLNSFPPDYFDGLDSPGGFLTTDHLQGLDQTDH